jgi:hypothetical protein
MLRVRFNLITAGPPRIGDCARYIEAEVRAGVESLPGSLGTSLYLSPDTAVAIFQSFWSSRTALVQSEEAVAPTRREAVRRAAGTVTVERYRVPVFELEAGLFPGAGVRLSRMDIEPARVPDAVEAYGDTAVPRLAETDGFCSALLLADQTSGHSISETIWRDPEALAASCSLAAEVRADLAAAAGWVIRAAEEYRLAFSSARKA